MKTKKIIAALCAASMSVLCAVGSVGAIDPATAKNLNDAGISCKDMQNAKRLQEEYDFAIALRAAGVDSDEDVANAIRLQMEFDAISNQNKAKKVVSLLGKGAKKDAFEAIKDKKKINKDVLADSAVFDFIGSVEDDNLKDGSSSLAGSSIVGPVGYSEYDFD